MALNTITNIIANELEKIGFPNLAFKGILDYSRHINSQTNKRVLFWCKIPSGHLCIAYTHMIVTPETPVIENIHIPSSPDFDPMAIVESIKAWLLTPSRNLSNSK